MVDLLERSPFLRQLHDFLSEVEAGQGRLVAVGGEAGVGKTALVQAFVQAIPTRVRVLLGACDPLSTPTPLGPLLDIAQAVGDPLASLLATGARRERVFDAFRTGLQAGPRPTVLVFEDAHWADDATLDLLRYLGRRLAPLPVLLVATYRDDEVGPTHPLRIVLGDLATSAAVRRLNLPPLSEGAVRELAGGSDVDARELFRQTGGNPFFVTEVLATGARAVPPTVRDAVLARASRLSSAGRATLEAAAIIGARVEPWLLESVSHVTDDGLEACLAAGVLQADGDVVAFRHELARNATLEAIPLTRRAGVHREVLAALRAVTGEPASWARLAHHAEAAGDREAVLAFAPLAAQRAVALGAHREAAAQYARALRSADDLPPVERARLLEARAYECYLIEQIDSAIEAHSAALRIWQDAGDRVQQSENLRRLALLNRMADHWPQADALAQQAVDVLESLAPGVPLAWAYSTRAHLCYLAGDVRGAGLWGDRAIALAEQHGETEILLYALNSVGTVRAYTGDREGIAMLERSLALAREAAIEDHMGRALVNLSSVFVRMHEPHAAERYVDEATLGYASEHDLDMHHSQLLGWRARWLLQRGQWTAATEEAAATLRRANVLARSRVNPLVVLGTVRARRGDPQDWGMLDEALALAPPIGEPIGGQAPVRAARAEAAWLMGDVTRARDEARAGFALAEANHDPWFTAELGYWRWRVGDLTALPPEAIGPFALQVANRWAAAVADWRTRGCPYEAAMAGIDGDETAVRESVRTFVELGAVPAAERAARRLRELGVAGPARGPRPSTRANPVGLTVRESEILELLAQGLRNADIGERLTLSIRTVDHHVSAVLSKLGARTRSEAVHRARELDVPGPG